MVVLLGSFVVGGGSKLYAEFSVHPRVVKASGGSLAIDNEDKVWGVHCSNSNASFIDHFVGAAFQ